MFGRLLLLFILIPLVELALLLKLASVTTPLFTFGLVIVTGVLGASLARQQGATTFLRLQRDLSQGKIPAAALSDALMIFVAGALLLTPGILTDIFGFSLLVPLCRHAYRSWLTARVSGRWHIVRPHDVDDSAYGDQQARTVTLDVESKPVQSDD